MLRAEDFNFQIQPQIVEGRAGVCAPKRHARGEKSGKAKFPDRVVREIRLVRSVQRASYGELAAMFHCSQSCVRDIVKGKTRLDAGGPLEGDA